MGRYAKPLSENLRSKVTAAYLADCLELPRSGWSLARWFEAEQGLPKGSVDEKNWRRFLGGHQPHLDRLEKVFSAVPQAKEFFQHPFWNAVNPSCSEEACIRILGSYGWQESRKPKQCIDELSGLPLLDQLAYLSAILSTSRGQFYSTLFSERLCVAYVETVCEPFWASFAEDLLIVLKLKRVKTSKTVMGLTDPEVSYALKLWPFLKEDFSSHENTSDPAAWAAWREAVFFLGWYDRAKIRSYIVERRSLGAGRGKLEGDNVYKKVRTKMYRTLKGYRKKPSISC